MKTRLITAAIGIPFLIFALAVRGWFAELLCVILMFVGLTECYRALKIKYHVCVWGGYLAAAAVWPLSRFVCDIDPILTIVAAVGISLTGVILSPKPTFEDAAVSVYPIITCYLPLSLLLTMVNRQYGEIQGVALITMAFSIAYGCDAAAFFGGKLYGRHKLAPTVSPKKTIEGAISGMVGGVFLALCCRGVCIYLFKYAMPSVMACIFLGLIGAFAGQIGDLTASLLKRHVGIKDYGRLFPGHGGVMDRFDSVMLTGIVLYCYTLFL